MIMSHLRPGFTMRGKPDKDILTSTTAFREKRVAARIIGVGPEISSSISIDSTSSSEYTLNPGAGRHPTASQNICPIPNCSLGMSPFHSAGDCRKMQYPRETGRSPLQPSLGEGGSRQ
jgi:hypothetical protein